MYSNWAQFKVKERAPDSQEKGTLLAMASYADDDGWECFVSEKVLAKHIGKSVRTIRRHIAALKLREEIGVIKAGYDGHRSQYYVIFCAEPTLSEREGRKAVPERQLQLPIPDVSLGNYEVVAEPSTRQRLAQIGVHLRTETEDKMSSQRGQDGLSERTRCPLTSPLPVNTKLKKDFFKKKTMENAEEDRKAVAEGHSVNWIAILREENPELADEFANLIENKAVNNVLQKEGDFDRHAVERAELRVARDIVAADMEIMRRRREELDAAAASVADVAQYFEGADNPPA